MKNMNKKGFTIVELVIVIAVIAILAGVLIPTFSGVVEKANSSAALQECRAALSDVLVMSDKAQVPENTAFYAKGYTFFYANSKLDETNSGTVDNTPKQVVLNKDYAKFEDTANVTFVTGIKDEGLKLIAAALGYDTAATAISVNAAAETPMVTVTISGYTTTSIQFLVAVSSDLSKNVVVATPDTTTPANTKVA